MNAPRGAAIARVFALVLWLGLFVIAFASAFGIIQTTLGSIISGKFPLNLDPAYALWLQVPNVWWLITVLLAACFLMLLLGPAVALKRRRSLAPGRIALFGLILIVAGSALWGMLQGGSRLASFLRGEHSPEIEPVAVWWITVSDVRVFWAALAIALFLTVLYFAIVYQVHVRQAGKGAADLESTSIEPSDVYRRAKTFRIAKWQRKLFTRMLFEPRLYFERIKESPVAYRRSTVVTTRYTFNARNLPQGAKRLVIPLYAASRGRLEDGLRINVGETSTTSFSHLETAAYLMMLVRVLIRAGGKRAAMAYERSDLERAVIAHFTDGTDAAALSRAEQRARTERTSQLGAGLLDLPYRRSGERHVYRAVRLLAELRDYSPIIVALEPDELAVSERGRMARITVVRRVIPPQSEYTVREVLRYVFFPRVRASDATSWRQFVANWQLAWSDQAPFRARLWAFSIRLRRAPALLARRANRLMGHVAGVGSNVIRHPLGNASRTASYHLELKGPDHTYLARQRILRPAFTFGTTESISTASAGQRHAHLYIRNGSSDLGLASYDATFFERTPGSMAIAFIAAVSSLIVATVIALQQLNALFESAEVPDPSGLLQVLLAFPVVAAASGVLIPGRTIWDGVLAARVANLFTVALTVLVFWVSSLPDTFHPDALPRVWLVILAGLLLISIGCLGSWIMRTLVHSRFIDEI